VLPKNSGQFIQTVGINQEKIDQNRIQNTPKVFHLCRYAVLKLESFQGSCCSSAEDTTTHPLKIPVKDNGFPFVDVKLDKNANILNYLPFGGMRPPRCHLHPGAVRADRRH
jgi:hypothetical protein